MLFVWKNDEGDKTKNAASILAAMDEAHWRVTTMRFE
jgi:hypothetical protein